MNTTQNTHVLIYGDIFVDYIATDKTNTSFAFANSTALLVVARAVG